MIFKQSISFDIKCDIFNGAGFFSGKEFLSLLLLLTNESIKRYAYAKYCSGDGPYVVDGVAEFGLFY